MKPLSLLLIFLSSLFYIPGLKAGIDTHPPHSLKKYLVAETVDPVSFTMGEATGLQGDTICLPVTVEDFIAVTSFQAELLWEPSVVSFLGFDSLTTLIPGFSSGFYSNTNQQTGDLSFLWYDLLGSDGYTLPDGSVLFKLCFKLVGGPGASSPVDWDIEVVSGEVDNVPVELPFQLQPGQLTIDSTDYILIECPADTFILADSMCMIEYVPDMPSVVTACDQGYSVVVEDEMGNAYSVGDTIKSLGGASGTLTFTAFSECGTEHACSVEMFLVDDSFDISGFCKELLVPAMPGNGELVVGVQSFVDSSALGTCLEPSDFTYSYQPFTPLAPGDEPALEKIFHCDHIYSMYGGVVPVEIYIYSQQELLGHCQTNITLKDPNSACGGDFFPDPEIKHLSCAGGSDGSIEFDTNISISFLSYLWSTGDTTKMIDSIEAGAYSITVTRADYANPGELIPYTFSFTVYEPDPLAIGWEVGPVSCIQNGFILAQAEGGTPPYSYEWSSSGTDTSWIAVPEGGDYSLSLTDANGCIIDTLITVPEDLDPPVIQWTSSSDSLNCQIQEILLDASATSAPDSFSINWQDPMGTALSDSAHLLVSAPDLYLIIAQNLENGCADSAWVTIDQDIQAPDFQLQATSDTLNCKTPEIILFTSDLQGEFSYTWQGLIDSFLMDSSAILLSQSDTFFLSVLNVNNGCWTDTSAVITANFNAPEVDAGPGDTLRCFEECVFYDQAEINGQTGTFFWLFEDVLPIGETNELLFDACMPGTYFLQAYNHQTGCMSEDSMLIVEKIYPEIPQIDDLYTCDESVWLTVDLPAGTSGLWEAVWGDINGVTIAEPELPQTTVAGLIIGENLFRFSLSTEDCPEYASTTFPVYRTGYPVAEQEYLELDRGETPGYINLAAKYNSDNYEITLFADAEYGTVFPDGEGGFQYIPPQNYSGQDQFSFRVCYIDCPENCDTASVVISLDNRLAAAHALEIPNTITANQDGYNDFWNIGGIELFPENDLVIFDRWGHVVFEQSPYNGFWGGTGKDGKALSHGVYYYVLRLKNRSDDVLKGWILLIRD